MNLSCVIVDDEPLAREGLQKYVEEIGFLSLAGTCANPVELSGLLSKQSVDLLYLDIQMPKMNGIEFMKLSPNLPLTILTTAYPSYALEGYQLDVLDYLLKPITFQRFFQAATKAKDYHSLLTQAQQPTTDNEFFFVKCDSRFEKIYLRDILFVEAMQNYVILQTTQGKFITRMTMKQAEEKLSGPGFLRVHKSFLVSIARVDSFESHQVGIGSHRIPVSRAYRETVKSCILNKHVWNQ